MDTFESGPVVAVGAKRGWRRHSDEFRARVTKLASQPGTSVAAVALANGLNANMLRRWVREAEASGDVTGAHGDAAGAAFVQVPMRAASSSVIAPSSPAAAGGAVSITVEIQRNGATVRASLPLDSASAAWLREVTG